MTHSSFASTMVLANEDTRIEANRADPDSAFRWLDEALREGRSARLSGELFANLSGVLGHEHAGRRWLLLRASQTGSGLADRIRDAVLAALALVALAPLFAVIALLVKLSSGGPVFYHTTVIGAQGQEFTWYKFRSMHPIPRDEDERWRREQFRAFATHSQSGPSVDKDTKVINVSRVTPIGRFIRKYSVDELPQLYNVLRGQMSLVGPRPCLPYEADLFPDWARRRFSVRPGLTGIWQVHGRGRVGLEEGLAMDVYYTYARSFWLDLKLILQTAVVVVQKQGAR